MNILIAFCRVRKGHHLAFTALGVIEIVGQWENDFNGWSIHTMDGCQPFNRNSDTYESFKTLADCKAWLTSQLLKA